MSRVTFTDKPRKVNFANYEQRLRKLLTVFELITAEIREALDQVEKDKHDA